VYSGGEYHGYSGDVSRTWPINGRFTSPQRELYEAVLHVQSAVLKTLASSRPSLDILYRIMCTEIASVLEEIGIVASSYTKEQKLKVSLPDIFCIVRNSSCPLKFSNQLTGNFYVATLFF